MFSVGYLEFVIFIKVINYDVLYSDKLLVCT